MLEVVLGRALALHARLTLDMHISIAYISSDNVSYDFDE